MNHDSIIKITNRIAIYATAALIYWVFIFLIITVFDLKIFREHMTEMFLLSLLGIFAVMTGAVILNVMSNLSKISAAVSLDKPIEMQKPRRIHSSFILGLVSFPVIAVCLFAGNELSAQRKKALLISSAEKLIAENQSALAAIAEYNFSPEYVKNTEKVLSVLNKIDKNFPEVMVILPDVIDEKRLFLGFGAQRYGYDESRKIEKISYIYSTSSDEREYLKQVFASNEMNYRFNAYQGNYQLYFPTAIAGKKIVLYFSDFQRYGKYGS